MDDVDLYSDAIAVVVPHELADGVLDDDRPNAIRVAPGIRDSTLAEIGSAVVFAAGAAADGVTLILAREHLKAFCRRLLAAMRRVRRDELEVSCRVGDSVLHFSVTTDDDELDVVRLLDGMAQALRAARDR